MLYSSDKRCAPNVRAPLENLRPTAKMWHWALSANFIYRHEMKILPHVPNMGGKNCVNIKSLKPIFHCDAKPLVLGPGVGLDSQHQNFALPIPTCCSVRN